MEYKSLFKMPKPMKITGRSSSITNAFINSIIPVVFPTENEIKTALSILGMNMDSYQCCYCGSAATEWDHLRPLVVDKKPTGYISEIHNLVPSCGKCNQSKGNKHWFDWIQSDANLSPKTKGVPDIQIRMDRLNAYEKWGDPTVVDFEAIVGVEIWQQHWRNWEIVQETMRNSQELADSINEKVAKRFKMNKDEV